MKQKKEYDWLEDPFKENQEDEEIKPHMKGTTKALIVLAFLLVIVLILVGAVLSLNAAVVMLNSGV